MMMEEFEKRTGFQPTANEYDSIEKAYYDFNGDKDEFYRSFVENGEERKFYAARATTIATLEQKIHERDKSHKKQIDLLMKRLVELRQQLDAELEWKPCEGGTNMTQERYSELASSGKWLTEQEAKELVAEEFGFSAEKVTIVEEVSTYEVDRHGRMRKAETYSRKPVYDATDWNYVRFNCAGWYYEMINGALMSYCC